MNGKRISTGMRLSETAKQQLEALSRHLGVSQTAIVELLIRDKFKVEGIRLETATEPEKTAA